MKTDDRKAVTLSLDVEEHVVSGILHFLQNGFMIKARVGCSLKEFFYGQLKLNPEYISKRISTLFLDGKPVDDINTAIIRDGSTVALSGAMPGLVGAVMRRGSFYASFRGSITYRGSGKNARREEGMVRIKLFNLVMKELGPVFLENGIFIRPSDFLGFLVNRWENFRSGCKEILLNGRPVEFSLLKDGQFVLQHDPVFFQVTMRKS